MRRITKRIFCTALALSMALPQSVPVFAEEMEITVAQTAEQNDVQSGEQDAGQAVEQNVNPSAEQDNEQTGYQVTFAVEHATIFIVVWKSVHIFREQFENMGGFF